MAKRYTELEKREAVRLIEEAGLTISQVGRELSVGVSTLHRWLEEYGTRKKSQFCEKLSDSERAEYERLKQENNKLKIKCEVLKKAALFFAQD